MAKENDILFLSLQKKRKSVSNEIKAHTCFPVWKNLYYFGQTLFLVLQIYKMFDEETHDVQLSQSINPDEKWK